MADVTISNLTYSLPSSSAFIPFTDNGVTLKVSPSGLYAKPGNTLLVGGESLADLFPTTIDTNLLPLSTYSAVIRGGWLLSVTERNTSWGDTAARIGVLRSGAGNGWWLSHNLDGSGAIHQSTQGDRLLITSAGYVKTPFQPIFRVSMTGGGGNQAAFIKVPFNYATVNVGGHYSLTDKQFNVPVDGNYHFTAGHMNSQNNTGVGTIEIRKNDVRQCYFHNSNSHPMSTSWSIILQCSKGDYINMYASHYHFGGVAESGYDYPTLMGYLIG